MWCDVEQNVAQNAAQNGRTKAFKIVTRQALNQCSQMNPTNPTRIDSEDQIALT